MEIILNHRFVIETKEIQGRTWFVARAYRQTPKGRYSKEKMVFGYRFRTEAERDNYVTKFKAGLEKAEADKATMKAKKSSYRQDFVNPYKVGDLFNDTWGWEQTNQDFYQVVAVGPRSVKIRRIGAITVETPHWCQAIVKADPDRFLDDKVITKVIQFLRDGKPYITSRHGWMTLTTPEETHHETSYA